MLSFFDYLFYRFYKYYLAKRNPTSELMATIMLSLVQLFVILDLFILSKVLFATSLPSKVVTLVIAAVVYAINWFRYEREPRVDLIQRYKDRGVTKEKTIGLYIKIVFGVIVSFPVIFGLLKNFGLRE